VQNAVGLSLPGTDCEVGAAPLSPACVTFFTSVLPALLVCIEGREGKSRSGGESLTPAAAATRRRFALEALLGVPRATANGIGFVKSLTSCFGTVLGCTLKDATSMLPFLSEQSVAHRLIAEDPLWERPCELSLLYTRAAERVRDSGRYLVLDYVSSDSFLGPLYRQLCCSQCGLLPDIWEGERFHACALCKDPAVGRFCCKEPCFAAFWRGGHKNECAGRDKGKKKGKEGGGEGSKGGGAGRSGSKK
jgi:hypothetical protein